MKAWSAVPMAMVALCAGAAHGQAAEGGNSASLGAVLSRFGIAPLERVLSPLSGIQLSADQDSSNATVKASFDHSYGGGAFDVVTFSVSSPVSKGGGKSNVISSGVIADSTIIDLQFSHLWAGGMIRSGKLINDAELASICDKAEAAYKAAQSKNDGGKADDFTCDSGNVAKYDPSDYGKFQSKFWNNETDAIFSVGSEGKITQKSFTYYNASSLAKASEDKKPWSVSIYAALIPPQASHLGDTVFNLKYSWGEDYKDQDTKTLCPPGGTGVTTCVTGAIGAPNLSRSSALSLEARHMFGAFAIAPLVSRDFEKKVTAVDFPIYLFSNGKDGLTGGVRVQWSSDKHQTVGGVFVTKAFAPIDF